MKRGEAHGWAWLGAALALLLAPALALAEATVTVQVRSASGTPPSGTVTLTPRGGGTSFSCTLHGGRCRIQGVPGGRYTARVRSTKGAGSAKPVMIPPEGQVSLILSVP